MPSQKARVHRSSTFDGSSWLEAIPACRDGLSVFNQITISQGVDRSIALHVVSVEPVPAQLQVIR